MLYKINYKMKRNNRMDDLPPAKKFKLDYSDQPKFLGGLYLPNDKYLQSLGDDKFFFINYKTKIQGVVDGENLKNYFQRDCSGTSKGGSEELLK